MAGLKITVPIAFTDTSLPIVYDDAILTPGSLLLVDPTHSANPWASGVPVNGTGNVPNIAWKQALAAGVGTNQSDNAASFNTDASYAANTTGLFERTGKGALHGIMSKVGNTAINQGGSLAGSLALRTYVFNNPTHSYYMSIWQYVTRVSAASTGGSNDYLGGIYGTANQGVSSQIAASIFLLSVDQPAVGNAKYLGGRLTNGQNSLGNNLRTIGSSGWTGTASDSAAHTNVLLNWGSHSDGVGNGASTLFNKHASHIIYRWYIEDLTVSGRTYATVDALDLARYTTDVQTVGGRYYGDTFTAVSTLP